MTDKEQEKLVMALIQLREARASVPHQRPPEREPFYGLKAEEQAAVLTLDHVPHSLGEIQTALRQALPDRAILIEDSYVGGRGYGNFSLRIGDRWLKLDEALDADRMGLYRIRLPEGV